MNRLDEQSIGWLRYLYRKATTPDNWDRDGGPREHWRKVYARILDEFVARHTSWWAAADWLTQVGHDPERGGYPAAYRGLIPSEHWGEYNVPGWTANGSDPSGLQWDPIAACEALRAPQSLITCRPPARL